jgi:hypothetical protein
MARLPMLRNMAIQEILQEVANNIDWRFDPEARYGLLQDFSQKWTHAINTNYPLTEIINQIVFGGVVYPSEIYTVVADSLLGRKSIVEVEKTWVLSENEIERFVVAALTDKPMLWQVCIQDDNSLIKRVAWMRNGNTGVPGNSYKLLWHDTSEEEKKFFLTYNYDALIGLINERFLEGVSYYLEPEYFQSLQQRRLI